MNYPGKYLSLLCSEMDYPCCKLISNGCISISKGYKSNSDDCISISKSYKSISKSYKSISDNCKLIS